MLMELASGKREVWASKNWKLLRILFSFDLIFYWSLQVTVFSFLGINSVSEGSLSSHYCRNGLGRLLASLNSLERSKVTACILSRSFIWTLHNSWINKVQSKTQCVNQQLSLPRARWFPFSPDFPVSSTYFPLFLGTVLLSKRNTSSYLTIPFPQVFFPWSFSR